MIDYRTLPDSAASATHSARHLSLVASTSASHCTAARTVPRDAIDAQLLAAVAERRDEGAFEGLYRAHFAGVASAAKQTCGDREIAEDIAQRTFMTLWERSERLAAKSVRVRPWLVTVARNAAIDMLRSQKVAAPCETSFPDANLASDPQEMAMTNVTLAELRAAVDALPAPQRKVVEMTYFQGMTFQAIADATGDAPGTVKSRGYLALERMRRSMCIPKKSHPLRRIVPSAHSAAIVKGRNFVSE